MQVDPTLKTTVSMTLDMARVSGNIHGGARFALSDRNTNSCGSRFSGVYCGTSNVDHVFMQRPVRAGQSQTFKASVTYTDRTYAKIDTRFEAASTGGSKE